MQETQRRGAPPEWAFEFHGHRCPFMPLGFRMGQAALAELGVGREADHTLHVIAELGEGHPQTCLMDGIQIATGATFGKTLIEKTHWGKLAATFWYPGKTAVRFALKPDFLDRFGAQEFFAYRKRGVEPSGIPTDVTQAAIDWTLSLADEEIKVAFAFIMWFFATQIALQLWGHLMRQRKLPAATDMRSTAVLRLAQTKRL